MSIIPSKEFRKAMIWPDTHCQWEDKHAVAIAREALAKGEFDRLIFLGDFTEHYATSRHLRNPDVSDCLAAEWAASNLLLDGIQKDAKRSGVTCTTYLEGNHEFNVQRYVLEHAPALRNMVSVDRGLRLKERGIGFKRYGDYHKEGKLHLVHDDDRAGANAHRDALNSYNASVGIGHTHQMAIAYIGDVLDRRHVGAMFGWLGDKNAEPFRYAKSRPKQKNWTLGFGTALIAKNGNAHVQVCPILPSGNSLEVCVFGKLIRL